MTLEEAQAVRGRFIRGEQVEQRLIAQADAVIALSKPPRVRAGERPSYARSAPQGAFRVLTGAIVCDASGTHLCAIEAVDFYSTNAAEAAPTT